MELILNNDQKRELCAILSVFDPTCIIGFYRVATSIKIITEDNNYGLKVFEIVTEEDFSTMPSKRLFSYKEVDLRF